MLVLLVGPTLIGAEGGRRRRGERGVGGAAAPDGKEVFASTGCGGCHTLAAAGTTGSVGPNLDDAKPSADDGRGDRDLGAGIDAVVQGTRCRRPRSTRCARSWPATEPPTATPTPHPRPAAASPRQPPTIASRPRPGRHHGRRLRRLGRQRQRRHAAALRRRLRPPRRASRSPPAASPTTRSWRAAPCGSWLSGDDAVLRIEGRRVTTVIPVGRAPEDLAVGGRQAVGHQRRRRHRHRASTSPPAQVTGEPIPVGGRPLGIAAGGDTVWVTSYDDGTVTRLDAASRRRRRARRSRSARTRAAWPSATARRGSRTPVTARSRGSTRRRRPSSATPIPVGRDPRELVGRRGLRVGRQRGRRDGDADRRRRGKVAGEPIEVGEDPIGIAVGGGAVWTTNFRDDTVTRTPA